MPTLSNLISEMLQQCNCGSKARKIITAQPSPPITSTLIEDIVGTVQDTEFPVYKKVF